MVAVVTTKSGSFGFRVAAPTDCLAACTTPGFELQGQLKVIEHLSNCHGEWNALFAFIGSLPFVKALVCFYFMEPNDKEE